MLVDDHPLFREGLAVAVQVEPDLELVAQAGTIAEVRDITARFELDVAVVDVLMPEVSGIGVTRELRDLAPNCRVLGLSAIDEVSAIAEMLRAGAAGYALKTQPAAEILEAVRITAAGDSYMPPSVARESIDAELTGGGAQPSLAQLTPREREIFELMIRGYSNSDIASRLFISLRTVETHRHRIVKKVCARSIVELQRLAARYGGL
jgi:two-component system NarL family response regulator